MKKKEMYFYLAAGGAVLLTEIGLSHGFYLCTFLPSMGVVMLVGFWAFDK